MDFEGFRRRKPSFFGYNRYMEDTYEQAKLSIELSILAKSIPPKNMKKAIEALQLLISQNAYKEQKRQYEAWAHQLLGQDECPWCGKQKPVRSVICHTCYANRD